MKCEYGTSIISFSGLKGHMKKKYHEEIKLHRCVYYVNELESINETKPVSQFFKSNPVIQPTIIVIHNILNWQAWRLIY